MTIVIKRLNCYLYMILFNSNEKIIALLKKGWYNVNIINNLVKEIDGQIIFDEWIEWEHHYDFDYGVLPDEIIKILDSVIKKLLSLMGHCNKCYMLNERHFLKTKKPKKLSINANGLLHERCHCKEKLISNPIPNFSSFAEMPLGKFTDYIFDEKKSKGKKELFESWGYTINDSKILKDEFERQAVKKYSSGKYEIGLLDEYGQRINIEIRLKVYSFKSGWMVNPKGKIINATPYGGKLK